MTETGWLPLTARLTTTCGEVRYFASFRGERLLQTRKGQPSCLDPSREWDINEAGWVNRDWLVGQAVQIVYMQRDLIPGAKHVFRECGDAARETALRLYADAWE